MTLFLNLLRRLYSTLLLLLPADVRVRHGAEMRDTSRQIVEDTLKRRGTTAALAAGLSECADVVRAAARASRRAPAEFRQDIRYAWRLMWARPAFALTIIATLAIGIGATTTVFTVVDALLLRPLPYRDPDRLVMLGALSQRNVQIAVSPRDYYDITSMMPSIESAAAYSEEQINITGGAEPERVDTATVTANFFDVVGAPFALGRGFTREEGIAGHERVAVLSHALWQRRFGGHSDIVGTTAMFDGRPYTIVGVAAAAMTLPARPQIWRPLVFTPHQLDPSQRGARWIAVIARLKSGVDVATADAEIRAIAQRMALDFPRTHRGRGATVQGLQSHLVHGERSGLLALFGAVALVLLIACANVANLLLARSSARVGEMTMRMALGASRGRLLRQCLAENLALTIIASAIGLAAAGSGTRVVTRYLPEALPRADEISVDWRVAAFAIATAIVLAMALGVVGALGLRGQTTSATTRTTRARCAHRASIACCRRGGDGAGASRRRGTLRQEPSESLRRVAGLRSVERADVLGDDAGRLVPGRSAGRAFRRALAYRARVETWRRSGIWDFWIAAHQRIRREHIVRAHRPFIRSRQRAGCRASRRDAGLLPRDAYSHRVGARLHRA
jgi:hypothetical protein